MSEDPKPPLLICGMIALATLSGIGAFVWLRRDTGPTAAAARVWAAQKDLSQVIELNHIYSRPPEPEDPSRYPSAASRQNSPSDRRP